MTITRNGSEATQMGPQEYFTGNVMINTTFQQDPPAVTSGGYVTFEPGARTHWHTHPLGQTLLVVSGTGWVQKYGELKETICPGDIVWIAPGEKHWHGSTVTTSMTHIAIAESLDGSSATWLEPVTEEQYLGN